MCIKFELLTLPIFTKQESRELMLCQNITELWGQYYAVKDSETDLRNYEDGTSKGLVEGGSTDIVSPFFWPVKKSNLDVCCDLS